jgi:hypothetical protein
MWYNVSVMRYDEMLRVRIPAELREKLLRRAEILQVSVSTLARWGLHFAATIDIADLLSWVGEKKETGDSETRDNE